VDGDFAVMHGRKIPSIINNTHTISDGYVVDHIHIEIEKYGLCYGGKSLFDSH
jgi:hypothetical protein